MNNEQTNIERGRCAGHLSITVNGADSAAIYLAVNSILTERSVFSRNLISLQEQIQTDRLTNVSIALGLVNALPVDNLYEQNFKTVSRIYLETIAQDNMTLSPSQFSAISAIAHQCIFEGGTAVLDARMLYQLNQAKHFSDDTLCQSADQRKQSIITNSDIKDLDIQLIPNPANEIVLIRGLTVEQNEIATIELWDLNGRLVETVLISGDQPMFNSSQIAKGVYACRIAKNGISVQTLKLVIIH